jgi:hypothetical protein
VVPGWRTVIDMPFKEKKLNRLGVDCKNRHVQVSINFEKGDHVGDWPTTEPKDAARIMGPTIPFNPGAKFAPTVPVGSCIYCGTTEYARDATRPLGGEHIRPQALGGTLELLEASCSKETSSARILIQVRRRHHWHLRSLLSPLVHLGSISLHIQTMTRQKEETSSLMTRDTAEPRPKQRRLKLNLGDGQLLQLNPTRSSLIHCPSHTGHWHDGSMDCMAECRYRREHWNNFREQRSCFRFESWRVGLDGEIHEGWTLEHARPAMDRDRPLHTFASFATALNALI